MVVTPFRTGRYTDPARPASGESSRGTFRGPRSQHAAAYTLSIGGHAGSSGTTRTCREDRPPR